MRHPWRIVHLTAAITAALALSSPAPAIRTLTFEQRVDAQRAIERVYYSHQIGASRPFDEAVPRELLEKKVRTYQRQSVALDKVWKTPVTAEALSREISRIQSATRLPERLREIYAALGNDTFLIQETIVRSSLVDRLSRNFFAGDRRLQSAHAGWDDWWDSASGSFNADAAHVVATPTLAENPVGSMVALSSRTAAACTGTDFWDNGILDDLPTPRSNQSSVWTGTHVIIWGGFGPSAQGLDSGARYDPATDTWASTSSVGAPSPRGAHTAVWTGSKMIVWGGRLSNSGYKNDGGQYDPTTDTWTPTSVSDAPPARSEHTAVWTGTSMVIWGGQGSSSSHREDGARYDPASNSWSLLSMANAPAGRLRHTAIWTGSRMIVWGGDNGISPNTIFNDGGLYDPASDAWTPVATTDAPAGRVGHSAIWTGNEMIVWGGTSAGFIDENSGGRYNPASDSWQATSMAGAPEIRQQHTAVRTGNRMIVRGGVHRPCCDYSEPRDTGGLYDPATDSWSATSQVNAPLARDNHAAVWTGSQMVVWGGHQTIVNIFGSSFTYSSTGGRYEPATDSWTPTSTLSSPPGGPGHSTVWTGSLLIDWGGVDTDASARVATGGRYDPLLDQWTPTSMVDAPMPRDQHSAVWTGSRMIIWGGFNTGAMGDGARYDPLADTWQQVSNSAAPEPRRGHVAVWTGGKMIVWGGSGSAGRLATGGVYDPLADAWTPTSSLDAPTARSNTTAVWSGSEMIVWGGLITASTRTATGGRYDPVSDLWTPTSTALAPTARSNHTAVWTGSAMAIWGGGISVSPFSANTGALYDPIADAWSATSTADAPSARSAHTAVWTGQEMLVWGGSGPSGSQSTGGRYDAVLDSWAATSTLGAPTGRSGHNAVWTGSQMLVWGGRQYTGGRYSLDQSADDDGDGFSVCGGDCNDADGAIHPGADEACNGQDDDCDGSVPASEIDQDGDGFSACQGDCNDAVASVYPGAIDLPGNPVDENCDGMRVCDPGLFWKNRGQFVWCVANACNALVSSAQITAEECDLLIKAAAQSGTGSRPRGRRGPPIPVEP